MPRCAKKKPVDLYWIPRDQDAYGWEGPTLLIGDHARRQDYDAISFTRGLSSFYHYPAHNFEIRQVRESEYPVDLTILSLWTARGVVSRETLNYTAQHMGLRNGGELATILRGLPNLARQLSAPNGSQ